MYRRILLPLALFSLAYLTAHAQESAVTASAEVASSAEAPITIAATRPLAFGTLTRRNTSTVASNSMFAGGFVINGDAGRQVAIVIPSTVLLTTMHGSVTNEDNRKMTATLDRANSRSSRIDDRGSASVLDASSGTATAQLSSDESGDGIAGDGLGQLYVWVGGSVTVSPVQQRGLYTGTFTVSVSYVN